MFSLLSDFFMWQLKREKTWWKKICSDNLGPYQVIFFPNSTFPRVQESLLWENLPFPCLSVTVCCLSRASVFPMVCFRQVHDCHCKSSLTSRNSLCSFVAQVLKMKWSIDKYWFDWLYESQTFTSMVFLRKRFFLGIVRNFPLLGFTQ